MLDELREERKCLSAEQVRPNETDDARRARIDKSVFARMDAALATVPSPRWLVEPRIAALIRDNLKHWAGIYYVLHRYVIMPNHVHILIEPLPVEQTGQSAVSDGQTGQSAPRGLGGGAGLQGGGAGQSVPPQYWALRKIMRTLKGYTARESNRILNRKGPFWQDENYDHWARDQAECCRIADYIDANPVKAGLCRYTDEWEWSSAFDDCDSQAWDVGQTV